MENNISKLFKMASWAVAQAITAGRLFNMGVQNLLLKTSDEIQQLLAYGQRPASAPVRLLSAARRPKAYAM